MAVKTHDTNPSLSSELVKEILLLENEVDKFLLEHLINGKAGYILSASGRKAIDILMERYRKAGWTVVLKYSSTNVFRIEFEDPDQLEPTKKIYLTKQSRIKG